MEQVTEFFSSPWWHVVTSAVATASLIANVTPNKVDNVVVRLLDAFIQALALNFRAKK